MVAIALPTAEINDQPAHFAGATAISHIHPTFAAHS
jgi:hypothetical protein